MLGLDDPVIWSGYLACILSTLLCIGYGAWHWNDNENDDASK